MKPLIIAGDFFGGLDALVMRRVNHGGWAFHSSYPKIDWVSVMAWTKIEEFKIELRDEIMKLKTLEGNEEKLVSLITSQVAKPPQQGGFLRQPMAELDYLAGDVRLPFWAQFLVIVLSAALIWLWSWVLENNTIKS